MKVIHRFKTYKREPFLVILQKKVRYNKEEVLGTCDPPDIDEPTIRLEEGQGDKQLPITAIHELTHAFFWEQPETAVDRFSKTAVTLLKKLGFKIIRKKTNGRSRSKPSLKREAARKSR